MSSDGPTFEVAPRPEPVEAVVRPAIDTYRRRAGAQDIGFDVQVDDLIVDVDAYWFNRALVGMLDHVFRETPASSLVTCRVVRQGGELVVSVRDTGHDMPVEHHGRSFRALTAPDTDTGTRRQTPDIGLCHKVVEAHGGRTWIQLLGPGQGAAFKVAIPLTQDLGHGGRPSVRTTDRLEEA